MSLLGVKQRSSQQDWLRVWEALIDHPRRERAEQMIERAARRVIRAQREFGQAVTAWSGGKDSLALQAVSEAAGVTPSFIVTSKLEWPTFLEWVNHHAPAGMDTHVREGINLEWLAQRPHMAFPQNAADASNWMLHIQRTGWREYCTEKDFPMVLLGGRRVDGNQTGKPLPFGGSGYEDSSGVYKFYPIYDWSHEDVLNVIACQGRELPPQYFWENGFPEGTGPWPARRYVGSPEAGWDFTFRKEPQLVKQAAEAGIPGAVEYLSRKN